MKFSVEELRTKAAKFQRRIWRRNIREYVAALIVIGFSAVACWKTPEIVPRVAYALVMAGAIFYIWYLRRWGSASPVPANMGTAACVRFYRDELARQRDLVGSVWKWITPILPGVVLLAAYNFAIASPGRRWQQIGYVAAEAALFIVVVWLNMRAARRLDRRIAELDRDLASM